MHLPFDVAMLGEWCRHACDWVAAAPHYFCNDDLAWRKPPPSPFQSTNSSPHFGRPSHRMMLALLCLFCAIGLYFYYTREHRKLRALVKNSPVKRSFWTKDQINACLLALGLAVTFAVLSFVLG